MPIPRRIVLTGGPGGGKTTFLARAQAMLHPIVVITMPEVAGGEKRAGDRSTTVAFQRRVLEKQLHAEDDRARWTEHPEKSVVLFDRGIFDAVGFLGEAGYERLLREFGLSPPDVLRRYDGVVFLRSGVPMGVAAGARFCTPNASAFVEHVLEMERRLLAALTCHEAMVVVEPELVVERKLAKLSIVCRGLMEL